MEQQTDLNGEAFSSFGPSPAKDISSIRGTHAFAKTVPSFSLNERWSC